MVQRRYGCNIHLFQLMLENQSRTKTSPLIIKEFNLIRFHSIKSYLSNKNILNTFSKRLCSVNRI